MPANLENAAVATGLEKVSFHSNPKEGQCQRMLELSLNYTHLTRWQGDAQNLFKLGFNSTWLDNGQMYKPDWEKGRGIDQIANIHWTMEKQKNSRKTSTSASLTTLKPLTVQITTNWEILKEMRIPEHLTCPLRNLYTGQEATIKIRQEQWTG